MAGLTKVKKQQLFKAGKCTRCKQKSKQPLKFIHDSADRTDLVVEKATADSRNALCPDCLAKREREMRNGLKLRAEGRLDWQKNGKAKPKKATAPAAKAKRQPRKKATAPKK